MIFTFCAGTEKLWRKLMFTRYELPYAFNALEPHIDALTMETHSTKHHATYTTNFNAKVTEAGLDGKTVEEILGNLEQVADAALRTALRNNGGGFYNHNLYFSILSPAAVHAPAGKLAEKINATFGNLDAAIEAITVKAIAQFGSGWAWLSANNAGELVVTATANQDNPISEKTGYTPILALDVWEHAYYLKYKNVRADYVKAFFNVLDWKKVSELYDAVTT